jgi:hypothetical protein
MANNLVAVAPGTSTVVKRPPKGSGWFSGASAGPLERDVAVGAEEALIVPATTRTANRGTEEKCFMVNLVDEFGRDDDT